MPYDLVVVGSGPGGYTAAIRAGQYGLKTAILEKDPYLGGTCLHVGCIPSKALLHAAELWDYVQHGEDYGITAENPKLDLPKIIKRKDGIVQKHARGIEMLMKKSKVEWIKGRGKLKGARKIEVTSEGSTKTIETKSVIIATGSEARMLPGLKPDDRILTNIEILKNTEVPKTLGVIGAGAVGVEFASMFARYGSKVTIFEMLPRLVPVEDADISKELEKAFKKQGIRCETGARVEKVQRTKDGVKLTATLGNGKEESFEFEKLLVGIGRKPNTEDIGLDTIQCEVEKDYIKTDGYMRTGEAGVYAIGDIVAGLPWLAHAASAEGLIAVAHIAGKPVQPIRKERIPGVTFTEPGIGSVGLTEAQAREQGHKVKVGRFPFVGNSKASILGHHEGFIKVVADEKFGEILGVHIIGPHGYELIGEAVAAMEAEATVETLMQTVHAHPTLYEAMGDAFNSVYGLAINA
jgi:dihydrolipoamide dehydrogenase